MSTRFGQDSEVEVQARFWSWSLVIILSLMFCRSYEIESWSRLCRRVSEARFCSIFWILSLAELLMFGWDFEVDAWSRFCSWSLVKICVRICDMNSTLGSVEPLEMFYVLLAVAPSDFIENEVWRSNRLLCNGSQPHSIWPHFPAEIHHSNSQNYFWARVIQWKVTSDLLEVVGQTTEVWIYRRYFGQMFFWEPFFYFCARKGSFAFWSWDPHREGRGE